MSRSEGRRTTKSRSPAATSRPAPGPAAILPRHRAPEPQGAVHDDADIIHDDANDMMNDVIINIYVVGIIGNDV